MSYGINNDFNFSWTTSDWNDHSAKSTMPSNEEKKVHDNYQKRDSITIRGFTVYNITSSSMGGVNATECFLKTVRGRDDVSLTGCTAKDVSSSMGGVNATKCFLKIVRGRDDVLLNACSATDVSSSMGEVKWNGWKDQESQGQESLPDISGRDGVSISDISAGNVQSSMGKVRIKNEKIDRVSIDRVSGRDEIFLKNATVQKADTTMGKLIGINCTITLISARDGVELRNSRSDKVMSSMGNIQAEDCHIESMEAKEGVKIKNCFGAEVTSSMGKISAFSEEISPRTFNLLKARDGVNLEGVSSKKVSSSMGPVNCNEGIFDVIQSSGSSSLQRAEIRKLELSIERGKETTIDLTDSVVGSIAVKIKDVITSCNFLMAPL